MLEVTEFHETELRVPSDKPPLRLVPEASNLDELVRVEFSSRDDVAGFLAGNETRKRKLLPATDVTKLRLACLLVVLWRTCVEDDRCQKEAVLNCGQHVQCSGSVTAW